MWVFPLLASGVAFVFAGRLFADFARRRQPYQLAWAIALAMYGVASFVVVLGGLNGWSDREFAVYWALGAVLNVPFLAGGELMLLVRNGVFRWAVWLVLIFLTAVTVATLRGAMPFDPAALAERLPSGKDVFGDGSPAHRLPQLISIPSYIVLVAGALWSAWRMRGRPELRDRSVGTLLIAAGATLIAGLGSAFAAVGNMPAFSISLLVGIAVMFAGFLRASKRREPAPT
jgi:hypothetical protein